MRNPLLRWSVAILAAVGLSVAGLGILHAPILGKIGLPHEYCYLQEPRLIWLHVVSDLAIGAAYVSISLTLAVIVYRASKSIPFNGVLLAFGLFIVSCGLTHFMEVWVVWQPLYWLAGYIKVFTACASVATAIALFPLTPKIFALIEASRKAEQRRLQIEELNQELERFNYSVAHDLRAPLRGIIGLGNALREDFSSDLPPLAQEYILKMEGSAAQMNMLVSDLLKYATIGTQKIQSVPLALDEILLHVKAALETEIRETGAEINIPESLPTVLGDATLLQVIFQNLLGNAIKFVAAGVKPRIDITATIKNGRATIFVTDNGIGIPKASREMIFGMFERANVNYPGTGIGLAIVRRAVERLRGQIGVSDRPEGTGTQFWIGFISVPRSELRRAGSF